MIFANWDAGQMGLVGAFEWIEVNLFSLQSNSQKINRFILFHNRNSAENAFAVLIS